MDEVKKDHCVGVIIIDNCNVANARRVKRLRVQPQIIATICGMNALLRIESKLPPTARMVSCHMGKDYDHTDCLWLFYECKEWDLVKEGDVIPELPWDTVTFIDEGND